MKINALYDEKCILCQEMKKKLQKLDVFQKIKWVSLQEYEQQSHAKSFHATDLRKELHILLPNGRVLKGFYAVRKLLLLSPFTFLLGLLLYFPFVPVVGRPVYSWVAKNRHLFMKKKCDDGSCSF